MHHLQLLLMKSDSKCIYNYIINDIGIPSIRNLEIRKSLWINGEQNIIYFLPSF